MAQNDVISGVQMQQCAGGRATGPHVPHPRLRGDARRLLAGYYGGYGVGDFTAVGLFPVGLAVPALASTRPSRRCGATQRRPRCPSRLLAQWLFHFKVYLSGRKAI